MESSVDCTSAARRRQVCIDGGDKTSNELEPGTARSMLSEMRATPLSDGESWDDEAKAALVQFQKSEGLPPTGGLDNVTVDRLKRRFEQFVDARHATGGDAVTKSPTAEAHRHVAHTVQHAVHGAESFAHQLGHDASLRAKYMQDVGEWAKDLMARFEAGQITEAEAALAANKMRNAFLTETRGQMSPAGQLISQMLKKEGLELPALIEKYAVKMYGKQTAQLTEKEFSAVCLRVAQRAGVTNANVNVGAKIAPVAGRALLAAAVALAIYQVATADDKVREAIKQGAGFLGFWAGAKAGAIAGGAVCAFTGVGAAAAPVCGVVGGLAGGLLGSILAEEAADHAYTAIKG
jgi:hypothetical protein